jgi:hypothetical protein
VRSANCASAEKVADEAINAYFAPNKTIAELQPGMKSGRGVDPLKEFAEAARNELQPFRLRFAARS